MSRTNPKIVRWISATVGIFLIVVLGMGAIRFFQLNQAIATLEEAYGGTVVFEAPMWLPNSWQKKALPYFHSSFSVFVPDRAVRDEDMPAIVDAICVLGDVNKIEFENCEFSDVGARELRRIQTLQYRDCPASDHDFPTGSPHSDCRFTLTLEGAKLSDAGLQNISHLTSIELLNLVGAPITSDGLRAIENFKEIRNLYLQGTKVDDSAVDLLIQLKSLKRLHVEATRISEAGIARLRKDLPGCEVNKAIVFWR